MLNIPRTTDPLDSLPSEIFSTPKRPLRDRSLSLSPSGSSSLEKMPSSPEKGVTFSTTSFYKPRLEYLNPLERMVAGKPKIYAVSSVLKPSKAKPNASGEKNPVSRSSHKPNPSKISKSITKPKQVVKPNEPVLSQKGIASALAAPSTPTKQRRNESPSKKDGKTNPDQLQSDAVKNSNGNTPTKRKSPRKSVSPAKRSSPGKGSPRRKKFFVVRSPTRDRKRWMGAAYAKTNFTLDFNKITKSAKRSSPKSEPKKQIRFDQMSEKMGTPSRPKQTSDKSSANTPATRSRTQPITPNVKATAEISSEEKLVAPTKRRKIESTNPRGNTASGHKSPVGSVGSPEDENGLSNDAVESSLSEAMDCENGVAEGGTSLLEDFLVPAQSKKTVTPKEGSASSSSPSRCYPIFEGNEKSRAKSASPNVQRSSRRSSPRRQSKRFLKSNGADQMIIDAGQRDLGARQCPSCGMVYSVGEVHDEMIHSKYHEEFFTVLRFPGWKKERVVGEFTDGRVIKVLPSDPAFMMRKVEDVRALVDRELGFCVFSLPSNPQSAFYLYVTLDKKILGCVIAETITSAFRVLPSDTPNGPPQTNKGWYCSTEPSKSLCGISRVWTELKHRRQKVATRLIDSLRGNFIYGQVLTMDDIAFSDPTPMGKEFATKYTGTETFLVYK